MHQTTTAIQAMFLALALLVFQSWGHFAVPQMEESPIVQQSDIEQGEDSQSLLQFSVPIAPDKGPEVRTAPPKTAKDSSKLTAFCSATPPVWEWVATGSVSSETGANYRARPPTQSSGYPHSHGNRGPPLFVL